MIQINRQHKNTTYNSVLPGYNKDSGFGIVRLLSHLAAELRPLEKIRTERLSSSGSEEATPDGEPDLIIRVEGHLIPVHSSVVSDYSATLRTMIMTLSTSDSKLRPVICLRGHSAENVNELIDFAYFPEKRIDGKYFV